MICAGSRGALQTLVPGGCGRRLWGPESELGSEEENQPVRQEPRRGVRGEEGRVGGPPGKREARDLVGPGSPPARLKLGDPGKSREQRRHWGPASAGPPRPPGKVRVSS